MATQKYTIIELQCNKKQYRKRISSERSEMSQADSFTNDETRFSRVNTVRRNIPTPSQNDCSASRTGITTTEDTASSNAPKLRTADGWDTQPSSFPELLSTNYNYLANFRINRNFDPESNDSEDFAAFFDHDSSYLLTEAPIEAGDVNIKKNASALPEIDRDTLSDVLAEMKPKPPAATDDTCLMDEEEEDTLSPDDVHMIDHFFSSHSIENLANIEFSDILLHETSLLDHFGQITDNATATVTTPNDCLDGRFREHIGQTDRSESPKMEVHTSSTTQCDFSKDDEKDRRKRNNVASRKSRAIKKERYAGMEVEIAKLQQENYQLREFVREIDDVIGEAKAIVFTINVKE